MHLKLIMFEENIRSRGMRIDLPVNGITKYTEFSTRVGTIVDQKKY